MLLQLGQVLGPVAAGEDAAVDGGMQRFDAAVQHLREAGQLRDAAHLQPGLGQVALAAAGGEELRPQLQQPARQLHGAGFIVRCDDGAHVS